MNQNTDTVAHRQSKCKSWFELKLLRTFFICWCDTSTIQVLIFSKITWETTSSSGLLCNYSKLILTANQNRQSTAETDYLTECHNQNMCEIDLASIYLNLYFEEKHIFSNTGHRLLQVHTSWIYLYWSAVKTVDLSRCTVTKILFTAPKVMLFYIFQY